MTPEKLAAHLRTEPERLLQEYSLFVIDEAHLLGDQERGWVLESALGFLNAATTHSEHRILLLSAALGNRAHVAAWMSSQGVAAQSFHQDWRGPRRAHALFSTDPDWEKEVVEPAKRKGGLVKKRVPLHGQIHVRTAPGRHTSLRTNDPISSLVLAARGGRWERDSETEPSYRVRARMATVFGSHGSVLLIEPTKVAAQRTALALAEQIGEDDPSCIALAALAANRVGTDHPLVQTLRRGVGFHHAALPDDVQAELEDGILKGPLRYLVATTTLIEGINFPVRSVLIGDTGYPTAQGPVTTLDAPKLLNAIGRAGRAGRETEGWIVLSLNKQFTPADFDAFAKTDEDLTATSRLATEQALDALAAFEESVRSGQDAVLQAADNAVADFISHVWFVAVGLGDLQRATEDAARLSIESTLAWQQLDGATRDRWKLVADLAAKRYAEIPEQTRRRWARTGTTLPVAAQLEALASQIRADMAGAEDLHDPVHAFVLVTDHGRLDQLLQLRDSHSRLFRPYRNAPLSKALDVDLRAMIVDWLKGSELEEMGKKYLMNVADETYRYEQLSEFVSQVLEHVLPWLLNTLVSWINEGIADDAKLCPELPAYLRFGVDSTSALELARGGIRSRRLVHAVAKVIAKETTVAIRDWLAQEDVRGWAKMFDASPSELADLLFFTRARDAQITSRVLAGEIVELPLLAHETTGSGSVELRESEEDPPARVGIYTDGHAVAYIRSEHHEDVGRLLAIGVPLTAVLTDQMTVRIRVNDPTQRTTWFETTES